MSLSVPYPSLCAEPSHGATGCVLINMCYKSSNFIPLPVSFVTPVSINRQESTEKVFKIGLCGFLILLKMSKIYKRNASLPLFRSLILCFSLLIWLRSAALPMWLRLKFTWQTLHLAVPRSELTFKSHSPYVGLSNEAS